MLGRSSRGYRSANPVATLQRFGLPPVNRLADTSNPRAPRADPVAPRGNTRAPALRCAFALALGALLAISFAVADAPAKKRGGPKAQWLSKVLLTEYYSVPESWFVGQLVDAPGLAGKHRIDWLYSGRGVTMEGDGIGLDGKRYHVENTGDGGWVNAAGKPTSGSPFWRAGAFWRNDEGDVTFPLETGGWSRGDGKQYVPLDGVKFAEGMSRPLQEYRSIAVDPKLIPLGSRVYIPAYKKHGGWFVARDTGGWINGRHIDVYVPAPAGPGEHGQSRSGQRIYVVAPGAKLPRKPPGGPPPVIEDATTPSPTTTAEAPAASPAGGVGSPAGSGGSAASTGR